MIEHFNRTHPTQEGPAIEDVPAPKREDRYSEHDIESTLDILFDKALVSGETHSQNMIEAGRGPTPRSHMATNSYHAIEIIRQLQFDLKEASFRSN